MSDSCWGKIDLRQYFITVTCICVGGALCHLFSLVKDLEHILVRLFQAKLLGYLIEVQIDLTLKVAYRFQTLVEVKGIVLADPEQKRHLSA